MLNRILLIGHLTRDPELSYTPQGHALAKVSIACDSGFGESKVTDFINLVVWRKQAEALAQYTKKGSLIAVEGRLRISSYDNKEGKKVYKTEVIVDNAKFLDSKKEDKQPTAHDLGKDVVFDDSDIPF